MLTNKCEQTNVNIVILHSSLFFWFFAITQPQNAKNSECKCVLTPDANIQLYVWGFFYAFLTGMNTGEEEALCGSYRVKAIWMGILKSFLNREVFLSFRVTLLIYSRGSQTSQREIWCLPGTQTYKKMHHGLPQHHKYIHNLLIKNTTNH